MPIDPSKVRVNHDPKMSLNSLGEYLTVGPGRRKTIIKNQKFQSTFITARYSEAEGAIADHIASSMDDNQPLLDTYSDLVNRVHSSDWKEQNAELCTDAIDSYADMVNELSLKGAVPVRNEPKPPKMFLAGVTISVRPEILLQNKAGELVGAIKLYFRKTKELNADTGKKIATVLRRYLIDELDGGGTIQPSKCLVVDIFGGQVHQAPAAYKRIMTDVESACEEIAVRWPSISLEGMPS